MRVKAASAAALISLCLLTPVTSAWAQNAAAAHPDKPVRLVVWVSSTSEDADLLATLRNIGPDGKDVWEVATHHPHFGNTLLQRHPLRLDSIINSKGALS